MIPTGFSPPQSLKPRDPECSITFDYRALSDNPAFVVLSFGLAAQAYLHVVTPTADFIVEGNRDKCKLVVHTTDNGLPNDHPRSDKIAGFISGPEVCDWIAQ